MPYLPSNRSESLDYPKLNEEKLKSDNEKILNDLINQWISDNIHNESDLKDKLDIILSLSLNEIRNIVYLIKSLNEIEQNETLPNEKLMSEFNEKIISWLKK